MLYWSENVNNICSKTLGGNLETDQYTDLKLRHHLPYGKVDM